MRFSTLSTILSIPAIALAQSSSSASGSASASASAASASASAGGAAGNSSDYLTAVLGALTGAGLTSLVTAAQSIAGESYGQALLGQLAQGNKTVFAPSNQALSNVSQEILGNTALLTQILSYHILNNTYTANGVATSPNHTIARSLLKGNYTLSGNFSAPLVLTKPSANATSFEIIQGTTNITANGNATAANLHVYIIDEVITLPQPLTEVLPSIAPQLFGLAGSIPGLADSLVASDGITIFAPNDAAIGAIQSSLGTLNSTQVTSVLSNHIINGTVVYSTGLASGNYTSAGGQPFRFISNSTGAYVSSANSTSRIVQSDIIIENGVVHIIDNVLVNTESNPQAASSAYSSAVAAASTSTEATAPVTATSAATTPSGSTSGAASAGFKIEPFGFTNSMVGGVVAVLGAVIGGAVTLF